MTATAPTYAECIGRAARILAAAALRIEQQELDRRLGSAAA